MSRGRDKDEGIAGRWSRLKRGAKGAPETAPETGPEATGKPAPEAAPSTEDGRPDHEVLAELGLPDPDTLKPGDDFAAFMAKAVPARLRNRALRRLWVSDPVLANLDGLVDYAEDYTDSAKVVGTLRTVYQVGRGMVDRLAEAGAAEEGTTKGATKGAGERPPGPDPETGPAAAAAESAAPERAGEPPDEAPVQPGEAAGSQPRKGPRPRIRFRTAED